jgi:hypothetical protein
MSNHKSRVNKLCRNLPNPDVEPIFYHWLNHPWTEEEKAEALRKHPDQKIFWKHLSDVTPIEGDHLQ